MTNPELPITPAMLEVIQRYLKTGDFSNLPTKEEDNDKA
jgi:hypothetical protein